jgi:hypothetical protein
LGVGTIIAGILIAVAILVLIGIIIVVVIAMNIPEQGDLYKYLESQGREYEDRGNTIYYTCPAGTPNYDPDVGLGGTASVCLGSYHIVESAVSLTYTYFHSHIFSEKFPAASISLSKTPTRLLRNDSFPPP